MKYFTALTIACFSLMNAHAFEPFANISVGNVSPDDLDASVSGFGAAAVPGTFELDGKESIKLEIGLKDDSGLSVGIQTAYNQMDIEDVSILGNPIGLALASLGAWNPAVPFDASGEVYTIPVLAFVGKEFPISDLLSIDLGLAAGYTTVEARPGGDLAGVFGQGNGNSWELQAKIGLDYQVSEKYSLGLDYSYSWLTGPEFGQATGEDLGHHFIGASIGLNF